jgi:hypothetical protein
MQYYFSSRMRRGFEYHMSHKAVADLKKQLKRGFEPQTTAAPSDGQLHKPHLDLNEVAHKVGSTLAAGILGQLLGDHSRTSAEDHSPDSKNGYSCEIAPTEGLPKEFGIRKSMFGIMTQPQILLSSEIDDSSTVLLTANVAKLRSFVVEDGEFVGDKVKGTVMRRYVISLLHANNSSLTYRGASSLLTEIMARWTACRAFILLTSRKIHIYRRRSCLWRYCWIPNSRLQRLTVWSRARNAASGWTSSISCVL